MATRVNPIALMRTIFGAEEKNKEGAVGVKLTARNKPAAQIPADTEPASATTAEAQRDAVRTAVSSRQTKKVVVLKEAFFQDAYIDARTIDSAFEAMGEYSFFEPVVYNVIYVVESGIGGGCVDAGIEWYSC